MRQGQTPDLDKSLHGWLSSVQNTTAIYSTMLPERLLRPIKLSRRVWHD